MRALPSLLHYRVFRRLMGSYLILAVATIATLASILYALFSSSATGEITENALVLLGRTARAADVLNEQIQAIGSHLISDLDVISYLYARQPDKILDYNAMRALDRVTSVYTCIPSIGLYNRQTGGYFNNAGMRSELPVSTPARGFADVAPRIIPAEASPDSNAHPVLTYMLYPYSSTGLPDGGAIEVNIDERHLRSLIESLSGEAEGVLTMVLDRSGIVLSHRDPSWFMKDASELGFAARVLANTADRGSFTTQIDGIPQLVCFVRSPASGWSFVMVQPYHSLIGNIERLKTITLLVAASLALLGALLSAFMTGVLYQPLRAIVDRVSPRDQGAHGRPTLDEYALISDTLSRYSSTAAELRRSLGASAPFLREAYVRGLMEGESRRESVPDEIVAEYEAHPRGGRFLVVALRMDDFEAWRKQLHPEEQTAVRALAAAIAVEHMAGVSPCDAAIMAEDEIALLIRRRPSEVADGIVLFLAEMQGLLLRRTKLSFTIGVGDSAYSLPEVRRSFETAAERCRYRLFCGPGHVIDEESIGARRKVLMHYPAALEARILDAVKLGDPALIARNVAEMVSAISGLSYYQFTIFVGRLLLAILWQFEETTELLDENYRDHDRLIRDVEGCESLAAVTAKIEDFCGKVGSLTGSGQNRASAKRNERLVAEVKQIVAERYAEPGLSIEIVADVAGLSPGYFAKLFKHVEGESFADYLNRTRLDKARALLTATHRSAQAIGESVGIHNPAYFSTLFKKTYGLSPSRYRERLHSTEPASS